MTSILERRKSAAHGIWLRFAGLCLASAAALCLATTARAETWWAGLGNAAELNENVYEGAPHRLQICLTGKTMQTNFAYVDKQIVPGAVVNVRLVWSNVNVPGPNTLPVPQAGPDLPHTDKFVKLPGPGPDGHYCDQGVTVKYSEFLRYPGQLPQNNPVYMQGMVEGIPYPDLELFGVTWNRISGTETIGNPASKIPSFGPRRMGNARPTFITPSNGQKFIGTNVTLRLTSHVGSWYCARGHYELDWQRSQVADSPNLLPFSQEWAAGPKPNLPCNAAGPATATVPFATLRSGTTEYHYSYEVRARIVGTGFQGAWSSWRKFYVEEPMPRFKPASQLRIRGPVKHMSLHGKHGSGSQSQHMRASPLLMQIHR